MNSSVKQKSQVYKQAEQHEFILFCRAEPNWLVTQQKQLNKHEQVIQKNTMISICQSF
jgi:hypothetical protein